MRKFSVKHMLGMSASPAALAAAEEEEKRKAAATAEDDSDDGDDSDAKKSKSKSKSKSKDADESDDDNADDEGDDSDDEDDAGDEQAQARTAAVRAARQQERERCGSIITSAEAEGRLALACHFAFNTGLSAKQAIASLAAAPKTQAASGSGLTAAMAALGSPKLGTDGKDASAAIDHGWDAAVAKAENLTGRKAGK